MDTGLKGRAALVTGGNSGIGLAIAEAFVAAGARVVISGRDRKTLASAAERLGATAHGVVADIRKLADIDALYRDAVAWCGPLDIVVANAGIAKAKPMSEMSEQLFDDIVATNLKGTYFTVQKGLPHLKKPASVILVSSALWRLGLPGESVYACTKAAIRSMARTFSAELLERGIRVNVLTPGPTATPIFDSIGLTPAELEAHIAKDIPMRRMAHPREIAGAAVFLASDASSYMAGSEIVVDGGHSQI
jgi:NAD(P)-dependent dehydrogenase (short-subunit alcohol dehydrogenase family)